MDHVVLDVEILKGPDELPGGWEDTHAMGVAVACLWEERTRRMRVYGPNELSELQTRIRQADRVTGYNVLNFDYPVIWGIEKAVWLDGVRLGTSTADDSVGHLKTELLPKTNDLLRRIWESLQLNPDRFQAKTHGGYPLDRVAEATIGAKKIGHGAEAPKWFQQGLVQKVVNYCADDVALTRDLAEFVDRYGYVMSPSGLKIEMRKD